MSETDYPRATSTRLDNPTPCVIPRAGGATPLRGWCRHNPLYHRGVATSPVGSQPRSGVDVGITHHTMVGGIREVAVQPRLRGWRIPRHVSPAIHATHVSPGRIRQPLKRGWDTLSPSRSYHAVAGYAYINPLTGLSFSYGMRSYHIMAGYAYINPLTGLTPWSSSPAEA